MDRHQPSEQGLAATHSFQTSQMLSRIEEVNTTCLDLLITPRRALERGPTNFTAEIRPLLVSAGPHARRRVAQQLLPLVDMHFRNDEWWRSVKSNPQRTWGVVPPDIPKRSGVRLARTTITLAWQSLHTDAELTRALFGMSPFVARAIETLRFTEIEEIAERQYRHVRPRWEDRPWLWLQLIEAAQSNEPNALREFHIHALQLLAGESLPPSKSV